MCVVWVCVCMYIYGGGEEGIGGDGSGSGNGNGNGGLSDCSQLLDDCCKWRAAAMCRGGMREDVIVTELNGLFVPNIYTQASSHWWNIMHYFGARRKNNVLKLAYFFYVKAICRG